MSVNARKRADQNPLENLAERVSAEINERATKMAPENRALADSETRDIVARVLHRETIL